MTSIEKVSNVEKAHLELIQELLIELTGNEDDLDAEKILNDLKYFSDNFILLFLKLNKNIVGVITIQEAFAFYAGGKYGIINELYIKPKFRSRGFGKFLIKETIKIAKEKNWKRIDVTAPPENKWKRTKEFYIRNGFQFTGPKLKYLIKDL
jgi:ribosomal protein S18 acetylase RimI-like enzyme